jgi:AcrR family transcriptional regulator
VRLADEGGIEAVSMRRVAKELGVEAMSLYNHVANKDEVLGGIIDLVAGEIELPADSSDWKSAIRQSAISTRDMFLRHRWASGLWMTAQGAGAARIRRGDWMLRTLREAGLSPDLTYHAYHIVESHILGFTFQQLSFPYKPEEISGMAERFLQRLPADDFPDFVEHVKQHLEPREGEGGFELGLDLVLDSLERLRDTA